VRAVPLPGEPDRFEERGPLPRTLIVDGRRVSAHLGRQIVGGKARRVGRAGDILIFDWQPDAGARP